MKKRIDLEKIIETFLYYTKINTTSVDGSKELPSCKNQYKLAEYVVSQFSDVPEVQTSIKENAIATIHLPANIPDAPSIVFFAHLDTAPDHSTDTHAFRVKKYNGGAIPFAGSVEKLSPQDNPELLNYIGQDIIVTDGTSLLGLTTKLPLQQVLKLSNI